MKKLSKLVLREHISPADLVSKKAQKFILGGSGGEGCACWGETSGKRCCHFPEQCDEFCGPQSSYCCGPCGLVLEMGCP